MAEASSGVEGESWVLPEDTKQLYEIDCYQQKPGKVCNLSEEENPSASTLYEYSSFIHLFIQLLQSVDTGVLI